MPGIKTQRLGPSQMEMAEVRGGYSLYRSTHFYERKSPAQLEVAARETIHGRTMLATGQPVRLQAQVGVPISFYKDTMRRNK